MTEKRNIIFSKILSSFLILGIVIAFMISGIMFQFIFFYPLFMSFVWMVGGIYFYFHWERDSASPTSPPKMETYPFISILVPCYNEQNNVVETIEAAVNQNYPNFEVIAIDDGSVDGTIHKLEELTLKYPVLRVVSMTFNEGKASALRMGAMVAKGEYLVCIDGDAMLEPNAAAHLVRPMINNPRVGAVTGNPRVRTRRTLIGRVQVGEYSSTIGLIKRAQRIYGQIFTVSGVIAAYRRTALQRCGYWNMNMATEDIDISWLLQLDHWSIQYEPNALCWILMPESYRDLWRQRLRWAQGGGEVLLKHIRTIWHWQYHRMWILVLDYCMSVAWSYAFALSLIFWAIGIWFPLPKELYIATILPAFWGLLLVTTNLLQAAVALFLESRYEPKLYRMVVWVIWYPMIFWLITMTTQVVGFSRAIIYKQMQRARWISPDRGVRP